VVPAPHPSSIIPAWNEPNATPRIIARRTLCKGVDVAAASDTAKQSMDSEMPIRMMRGRSMYHYGWRVIAIKRRDIHRTSYDQIVIPWML
jgi:hypothetical protein